MTNPVIIFYHCLFQIDGRSLPAAEPIIREQIKILGDSGLISSCSRFIVGVNGGKESLAVAASVMPRNAYMAFHGLECRNENLTILEIEKFLKEVEGEFNVLYFHSKGATRPSGEEQSRRWRNCMMRNLITNWRTCVSDLDSGFEAVGCHWMQPPATPEGQAIFAGNFWWAKASYLRTLPSIMERARIKESGIEALESRYESEVWLCNGPRLPIIKNYHHGWINTCEP